MGAQIKKKNMDSEPQQHLDDLGEARSWAGDFDPFADAEERRVLFAAFDSFRYVHHEPTWARRF